MDHVQGVGGGGGWGCVAAWQGTQVTGGGDPYGPTLHPGAGRLGVSRWAAVPPANLRSPRVRAGVIDRPHTNCISDYLIDIYVISVSRPTKRPMSVDTTTRKENWKLPKSPSYSQRKIS